MPGGPPLLDFSSPTNPRKRREGEGLSENSQAKTKQKTRNQIDFLRLAIELEHNFNHTLPSAGRGTSAAQSVSLVGTVFQLEVNDSNDNSYCWERTKCESELKIPGPSSGLFRRSVNTQLSS